MATRTPMIYVAHKTRLDLKEAEKFGRIVFATHEVDPYPAQGDAVRSRKEGILKDMEFNLEKFDSRIDYLLMVGDPIYCGLLLFTAMQRTEAGDTVNVLRYDRLLKVYIPVEVLV